VLCGLRVNRYLSNIAIMAGRLSVLNVESSDT
jgi:hypothetical protein